MPADPRWRRRGSGRPPDSVLARRGESEGRGPLKESRPRYPGRPLEKYAVFYQITVSPKFQIIRVYDGLLQFSLRVPIAARAQR